MALRNGGSHRLLIQKGTDYSSLASIYLKIALIFNTLALVLLGIMAVILSELYESTVLGQMIWIIGLTLPMGSAAIIFQAKLSSLLEFKKLAQVTIWSAGIRNGTMILFAWAGYGPLSFVLPIFLVAAFETVIGWYWAGGWPNNLPLTLPILGRVLKDTRWVMLTALASALTVNGDYIAVSFLQSKEILGEYFFGYQLSLSLVLMFTSSLDSVMLPTFSFLNSNSQQQQAIFLRGARLLAIVATFACFGLLLTAQPFIHFLWNGKWDNAIPVVQLLSLSMPIRLIVPLCRSILESRGQWKLVSVLFTVDGIATILAGVVGAWHGSLFSIAAVVSGYNIVFSLFYCGIAVVRIGGRVRDIFAPMGYSYGIGLMAVFICSILASQFEAVRFWDTALLLLFYVSSYLALTKIFQKQSFRDITNLAINRAMPVFR